MVLFLVLELAGGLMEESAIPSGPRKELINKHCSEFMQLIKIVLTFHSLMHIDLGLFFPLNIYNKMIVDIIYWCYICFCNLFHVYVVDIIEY
ncbi:hypothetical protein HanPI659440_Chr15g0583181 [Helianthus annuus]|nr:hypothetical protein HanPI659440_Chr15g0583181 [Helianthus annuus]